MSRNKALRTLERRLAHLAEEVFELGVESEFPPEFWQDLERRLEARTDELRKIEGACAPSYPSPSNEDRRGRLPDAGLEVSISTSSEVVGMPPTTGGSFFIVHCAYQDVAATLARLQAATGCESILICCDVPSHIPTQGMPDGFAFSAGGVFAADNYERHALARRSAWGTLAGKAYRRLGPYAPGDLTSPSSCRLELPVDTGPALIATLDPIVPIIPNDADIMSCGHTLPYVPLGSLLCAAISDAEMGDSSCRFYSALPRSKSS